MHGIGPGTVLGDRYALRRRLSRRDDVERWTAHDATLERDVTITCLETEHPNAPAVLDAARRAAGVEDARFVRVLDVGTREGISWVVEEHVRGAQSVAELLGQGGLPAEEARRIAGEAATALEVARQRGLHHLCLTPGTVLRASDGSVKVQGIEVLAALEGAEEPDPVAASRADTVALVALAYAALTSRWPSPLAVAGLDPAPQVGDGVAAPSEIAAGVPGDLDALCRLTLNEDAGPLTPGDFASQIAPWSRTAIERGDAAPPTVVLSGPLGPGASTGTEATTVLPPVPPPGRHEAPTGGDTAGSGDAGGNTTSDSNTGGVAAAVGSALGGTVAAASTVSGRVGTFARAAAEKAAGRHGGRGQGDLEGERLSLPDALRIREEPLEPPLPLLPPDTADRPSRDQTKLVVMIVAGFVIVALLLGYCGVRQIGSGVSLPSATPRRTVTVTATPTTVTPSPTASPTPKAAAAPLAVLSATGFDPKGDGSEKDSLAGKAYDKDPSTAWTSEGYSSAAFGGLKDGVGLLLDLGQTQDVHQADLVIGGTGSDLTVYVSNKPSLDGATALGTVSGASGNVSVKAGGTAPKGQFVIIWFTKLAQDGGRYRASVAEVALS